MLYQISSTIFVLLRLLDTAESAGTCQAFPLEPDHTLFCSGVVNYPFFIPEGQDETTYLRTQDTTAADRAQIGGPISPLPFFPTECKDSLKRLFCAEVFLPCIEDTEGIVVGSQLPCKALCEDTTGPEFVCGDLMSQFGFAPSSSDCHDPSKFSQSTDTAMCNNMTFAQVSHFFLFLFLCLFSFFYV